MPYNLIEALSEVEVDELPNNNSSYELFNTAFEFNQSTVEQRKEAVIALITNLAKRLKPFTEGTLEEVEVWRVSVGSRPIDERIRKHSIYGHLTKNFSPIKVYGERAPVIPYNSMNSMTCYLETKEQALDWRVRQLTQAINENNNLRTDYGVYLEQAKADFHYFHNPPKSVSDFSVGRSGGTIYAPTRTMRMSRYQPVTYDANTSFTEATVSGYTQAVERGTSVLNELTTATQGFWLDEPATIENE